MTTHYLRTRDNATLVDIEATEQDIQCVVPILGYSMELLCFDPSGQTKFMLDMADIQEIRAEYWETPAQTETPNQLAERRCKELAKRWKLFYVTD